MAKDLVVYMVKLSIGRKRLVKEIDLDELGLDIKDKSLQLLLKNHADSIKLNVFAKSFEKILTNFESKVRMSFRRRAVIYEWGESSLTLMTKEMYEDYLKEFEQYKNEYYGLRDEILKKYDDMINSFIALIKDAVKDKSKQKALIKTMQGVIPHPGVYENSFYMSLDFKTLNLADDDKQDMVKSFLMKSVDKIHAVALKLQESYLKSEKDQIAKAKSLGLPVGKVVGKIPSRTIGAITSSINAIQETNIIGHNGINKLVKYLEDVRKNPSGTSTKDLIKLILDEAYKLKFTI